MDFLMLTSGNGGGDRVGRAAEYSSSHPPCVTLCVYMCMYVGIHSIILHYFAL